MEEKEKEKKERGERKGTCEEKKTLFLQPPPEPLRICPPPFPVTNHSLFLVALKNDTATLTTS